MLLKLLLLTRQPVFFALCVWPLLVNCSRQTSLKEDTKPTWRSKYGLQLDQPFSGPLSFAHLPYSRCLEEEEASFDIAILGLPFDTGVTFRPGYAGLTWILKSTPF